MRKIIKKILHGGPLNGNWTEIHEDNLKTQPILNCEGADGQCHEYGLAADGEFHFSEDAAQDPRFKKGGLIFDDDGTVLAEVDDPAEAFQVLDLLEEAENLKKEVK